MKRNFKLILLIVLAFIIVFLGIYFIIFNKWAGADSGNQILSAQRHFTHIRTYASVDADSSNFPNFVDFINQKFDLIRSNYASPGLTNTSNFKYINLTDINQTRAEFLRANEDYKANNQNFDNLFIHYAKDTALIGRTTFIKSIKPDRFSAVLLAKAGSGTSLTDFFTYDDKGTIRTNLDRAAYGEFSDITVLNNLDFVLDGTHNAFLVGFPWPYREVFFNVTKTPTNSLWQSGVKYQYLDNAGNWTDLANIYNAPGWQPGENQLYFSPPLYNWAKREVVWGSGMTDRSSLYWLRVVCTAADCSGGPVLHSEQATSGQYAWDGIAAIRTTGYQTETTASSDYLKITIPGWDENNETKTLKDGYVDNDEFPIRPNKFASARFKYQSRVPSTYASGRWVTNIANDYFKNNYLSTYLGTYLSSYNNGFYLDNALFDYIPDKHSGTDSYLEFTRDTTSANQKYNTAIKNLISAVKVQTGKPWVVNSHIGNLDTTETNPVGNADGVMEEFYISFENGSKETTRYIQSFKKKLDDLCALNKAVPIRATPDNNPSSIIKTSDRSRIYALARYYLTANNCTFYSYQGSVKENNDYGSNPETYWYGAIEYNIGNVKPNTFTPLATNPNSEITTSNLFSNPGFENELSGDWVVENVPSVPSTITGSRDSTVKRSGSYSFKLTSSGTDGIGRLKRVNVSSLNSDTTYTLGAWVRTDYVPDKRSTVTLSFCGNDSSGTQQCDDALFPFADSATRTVANESERWMYVSVVSKTPLDMKTLFIRLSMSDVIGSVWIDDMSLREGSFPQEYVYSRDYENAKIIVKPSVSGEIDLETTIPLDGFYQKLKDDGTLGSIANSINLRGYEAAILVPVKMLTASTTQTSIARGGQITYTIKMENKTGQTLSNIVITNNLPAGTTFISATNGGALDGPQIKWPTQTLAAGAIFQPTFTVRAN